MVDCLNQNSKHCGKMPRQQKTDHAKALANLAFWAIFPCISLPLLTLTLLQRSRAQIFSGCINHPPVWAPTSQSSCKLPFLWIFVCSVACTREYGIVTFSTLTVNVDVPDQEGKVAPVLSVVVQKGQGHRDSTTTAATAHEAQQPLSLSGRGFSACVLSTPSFHDSVKWLHANTANAVCQEFILAFDVAAITAQSFWSAVISFNNQNDSHSESFIPLQRQCVLS